MPQIESTPLVRYLRIVWSAFFGILCLLLIWLWVRSFTFGDVLYTPVSHTRLSVFGSGRGGISFSPYVPCVEDYLGVRYYELRTEAIDEQVKERWNKLPWSARVLRIGVLRNGAITSILLPHFLFVAMTILAAAAPWIPNWKWRFSIRTLLIFTTVVAVVLGLIVWTSRK
jgi:hypothetical protein